MCQCVACVVHGKLKLRHTLISQLIASGAWCTQYDAINATVAVDKFISFYFFLDIFSSIFFSTQLRSK